MAFGIPGTDSGGGSGGEFLGRIQYDTRTGFWKTVDRDQNSDGSWSDKESDFYRDPTFLADFGSFEAGYAKLTSPPVFLMVPMGQPYPPQPQELGEKGRKAFQGGCRLKVAAPKLFGDDAARYFTVTAKTVLGPMEALWVQFQNAPEATSGRVPLVQVKGTTLIEVKTPEGKSKFHAPNFVIVGWKDRLPCFGERTVPAPGGNAAAPAAASHAPPPGHVPPPAPAAAPSPSAMPDW